jgi:hypothetical protein
MIYGRRMSFAISMMAGLFLLASVLGLRGGIPENSITARAPGLAAALDGRAESKIFDRIRPFGKFNQQLGREQWDPNQNGWIERQSDRDFSDYRHPGWDLWMTPGKGSAQAGVRILGQITATAKRTGFNRMESLTGLRFAPRC